MITKIKERKKALELRKKGLTYSEILEQVPVAKSTLSTWFKGVGLAKEQRQKITHKRKLGSRKGALKRKNDRIERTKRIKQDAKKEIKRINNRELWLIGISLYWAEGTKEKEYRVGERVAFSNSDPKMISLFKKWLLNSCMIPEKEIVHDLYIHRNLDVGKALSYWSETLNIPKDEFRTYYKDSKVPKRRIHRGNSRGLIRISVQKSIDLNRKIDGWVQGICDCCGIV